MRHDASMLFREGPSGLLIPQGMAVGGMFYPNASGPVRSAMRKKLLESRVGVVPDFRDIWPGETAEIAKLFEALPRQTWLSFLSRFALAAYSPTIALDEFENSILHLLSAKQRERLAARFPH